MSQMIEVAAALIFRNGKILITQRNAKSHLGGLWEFPGGKRETGETFEQCLVREIREELGVEISVVDLFEEIWHDYPEKSVRLKFFICKLLSGEPQPLDCAAVKWVEKNGACGVSIPRRRRAVAGEIKKSAFCVGLKFVAGRFAIINERPVRRCDPV